MVRFLQRKERNLPAMLNLRFVGAARTTTGSLHSVEYDGRRVLVDCGLLQGHRKESFEANRIRSAPDPGHAIQMARGLAQQAGPQAVVLVIGSVYLAGQIKALLATAAGAGEDF